MKCPKCDVKMDYFNGGLYVCTECGMGYDAKREIWLSFEEVSKIFHEMSQLS